MVMVHSTRLATAIAAAGVLGTLLGATISPLVNFLTNKREMDLKTMEIAIEVLRAPPTDDAVVMRTWAVDAIEHSSGQKFTEAQRNALLKKELPTIQFSDEAMAALRHASEAAREAIKNAPSPPH